MKIFIIFMLVCGLSSQISVRLKRAQEESIVPDWLKVLFSIIEVALSVLAVIFVIKAVIFVIKL